MRFTFSLAALTAVATAAVVPLERRQHMESMSMGDMLGSLSSLSSLIPAGGMGQYGKLMASIMPKKKAYKIEEIKPVLRPDAKRIRITYGPYAIRGQGVKQKMGTFFSFDKAGTAYSNSIDRDFPTDITILDTTSMVTDEQFKPIDIAQRLYNHHNVFYDMSTPPAKFLQCPGQKATSGVPVTLFIAGATEALPYRFTSNDGKLKAGFYLKPDATVFNLVDVINYNNETRNVYTVSEMEYMPGKIDGALDVLQDVVNIGMCTPGLNGMSIHAKGQKRFSLSPNPIEIAQDGKIVSIRAHLHDGGDNIVVKLNDKEICNSKAQYGGEGHEGVSPSGVKWESIQETTDCGNVVDVKKGDTLSITANYDMIAHNPRESPTGEEAEDMALLLIAYAKSP